MSRLNLHRQEQNQTHDKHKHLSSSLCRGFCTSVLFICFRSENVSYISHQQVVKSQPYVDYFQKTSPKMKTNIRLWMYTPNATVWYPFYLTWSGIINPRCTCAARVTVVILCVCVSVCPFSLFCLLVLLGVQREVSAATAKENLKKLFSLKLLSSIVRSVVNLRYCD